MTIYSLNKVLEELKGHIVQIQIKNNDFNPYGILVCEGDEKISSSKIGFIKLAPLENIRDRAHYQERLTGDKVTPKELVEESYISQPQYVEKNQIKMIFDFGQPWSLNARIKLKSQEVNTSGDSTE